jgi:WD40 repeat protein
LIQAIFVSMIRNPVLLFLPFFLLSVLFNEKEWNTSDPGSTERTFTAWTASWSYDDKFIAVGNDNGELAVYETATWKKIKSWRYANATIARVEWNPKYPLLGVAGSSFKGSPDILQLYDVVKGEVISTLPDTVRGRGITWSPDGEQVAYTGARGKVSIFYRDGKLRKVLSFPFHRTLLDVDWHPAREELLVVEEDIHLLDISNNKIITYDDGSKNKGILSCQWHLSGKFFVTGDYGHENEGGEPSYLRYWNENGSMLKQLKESKYEYRNLKWSKDGKYLAASTDVLLILDEKGKLISKTKFDNNNLWGVEWSNKGDRIITTDGAGNIRVVTTDGRVLKTFVL